MAPPAASCSATLPTAAAAASTSAPSSAQSTTYLLKVKDSIWTPYKRARNGCDACGGLTREDMADSYPKDVCECVQLVGLRPCTEAWDWKTDEVYQIATELSAKIDAVSDDLLSGLPDGKSREKGKGKEGETASVTEQDRQDTENRRREHKSYRSFIKDSVEAVKTSVLLSAKAIELDAATGSTNIDTALRKSYELSLKDQHSAASAGSEGASSSSKTHKRSSLLHSTKDHRKPSKQYPHKSSRFDESDHVLEWYNQLQGAVPSSMRSEAKTIAELAAVIRLKRNWGSRLWPYDEGPVRRALGDEAFHQIAGLEGMMARKYGDKPANAYILALDDMRTAMQTHQSESNKAEGADTTEKMSAA